MLRKLVFGALLAGCVSCGNASDDFAATAELKSEPSGGEAFTIEFPFESHHRDWFLQDSEGKSLYLLWPESVGDEPYYSEVVDGEDVLVEPVEAIGVVDGTPWETQLVLPASLPAGDYRVCNATKDNLCASVPLR